MQVIVMAMERRSSAIPKIYISRYVMNTSTIVFIRMEDFRNSPSHGIEETTSSHFGEGIFPLLEPIAGSKNSSSPLPQCILDLANMNSQCNCYLSLIPNLI